MHPLDHFGFGLSARRRTSLCLFIAVLSICFVPFDSGGQEAVQLGETLEGPAGDGFATSTGFSAEGNTLVVGGPGHTGTGFAVDAGHILVFDWDGDEWLQRGEDIEGEDVRDMFGTAVAISADGNRVAAGAPDNNDNGDDAGHVRVYDWTGEEWQQVGESITGANEDDEFGSSLAFSANGNILAIGSRLNGDIEFSSGEVRVFEWNESESLWQQYGNTLNGQEEYDLFSHSISMAETTSRMVISASTNNLTQPFTDGYVCVYDYDEALMEWIQVGDTLRGSDGQDAYGFATSIAPDGNRVAISDPRSGTGYVGQVFDWDGTSWNQPGNDLTGSETGEQFGYAISLSASGDKMAISSPNFRGGGVGGITQFFELINEEVWVRLGEPIAAEPREFFGYSTVLDTSGTRVAIGTPLASGRGGYVKVYDISELTTSVLSPSDINLITTVFPNPASSDIQIEFSMDHPVPYEVSLTDASGRLVRMFQETGVRGINRVKMDVSQFARGTYQVMVRFDGKVGSGVVVVGG